MSDNPEKIEAIRLRMENELIEMRDARMFVLNNNGLVVKEKDGRNSDMIRMGTAEAVRLILRWSKEYDRDTPNPPGGATTDPIQD